VTLHITIERDVLQITVGDNGSGFDSGTVAASSNGLENMQQRMAAVHGLVAVESEPGKGCAVTFTLPVAG
jgi:two-component system NarL family sensor kinase